MQFKELALFISELRARLGRGLVCTGASVDAPAYSGRYARRFRTDAGAINYDASSVSVAFADGSWLMYEPGVLFPVAPVVAAVEAVDGARFNDTPRG